MWVPFALAALFLAPDPEGLGDSDWATREQTESTFRALGPFGWPALRRSESESPEVRFRAARLLAPYRAARDDAHAYAVLWGVYPVTPNQLWHDHPLRYRLYRLAVECGAPAWYANRLLPERWDEEGLFWWPESRPEECCEALEDCRRLAHY